MSLFLILKVVTIGVGTRSRSDEHIWIILMILTLKKCAEENKLKWYKKIIIKENNAKSKWSD